MNRIVYALGAALFYAFSMPFSKQLLLHVDTTYMASFLYLGAGAGVGIMYAFHWKKEKPSDRLERKDLPYTIGMIVLDILAPIFMMLGLGLGSASSASVLGNFEIVMTSLIAFIAFGEKISRTLWAAIALITCASIILTFDGGGEFSLSMGSVFVIAATCCWGLENNCTRSISGKSTYEIVTLKGLCSGAGAFVIATAIGEDMPELRYVIYAMVLGFASYGLRIFMYVRAQKYLGAAKTSAYYASAPFIGAGLSFAVNSEQLNMTFLFALIIMLAGTGLVLKDTLSDNGGTDCDKKNN